MILVGWLLQSAAYLAGFAMALRGETLHRRAARFLALYFLLAGSFAILQALELAGRLAAAPASIMLRLPYYTTLGLSVAFLLLSRAYLRGRWRPRLWAFAGLAWLGLILLFDLNPFRLPDIVWIATGWFSRPRLLDLGLFAGWVVFSLGALYLTLRPLRRHQSHLYLNMVSYWLAAFALITGGDILTFLRYVQPGQWVHLAGAVAAGFAVLAYRLPGFAFTVRRALLSIVFTGLTILIYGLGLYYAYAFFDKLPGFPPLAGVALVAALLVLVLNPLLTWLNQFANRLATGKRRNTALLLRQYSQSITNILELDLLAQTAVKTASEMFGVQNGFLFLVENERAPEENPIFHLRGVQGKGETGPEEMRLPEESVLADFWRYEHRPITQLEINLDPRFRAISRDERRWLAGLKTYIYAPIYSKNEWIGLLGLGPRPGGSPFDAESLDWLGTLADQTAIALENTRLMEGMLRLNREFRRAYAGLEKANLNLERLDRNKSDFISIASHELRTPLTIVSGSSQILLEDPQLQSNPYHQQLLSKIRTGALRLEEIVEAMLDIAKIDTGDLQLDPQPVTLHGLVRTIAREVENDLHQRQQKLDFSDLAGLPTFLGDSEALRKVLYHLLVNAIKFTPDGGQITVTGKCLDPSEQYPQGGIEAVISDNGIGVDPSVQELIFHKFYQTGEVGLHSTGKTKFKGGGPGLGLTIVRGLVEAHGGRVWVESPGHDEHACPGSQFHVQLPVEPLAPAYRPNLVKPDNP